MWTVRIVQSGKVTEDNLIRKIQPKLHKVNIVRLEDMVSAVMGTGIDERCISIIELENADTIS